MPCGLSATALPSFPSVRKGAGFQRRSVTARCLEVTVVLLLPLVYPVELRRDGVLKQGRLRLPLDLLLYLSVYQLVSLYQRRPFQRIRGGNLRFAMLRKQAEGNGGQKHVNDS